MKSNYRKEYKKHVSKFTKSLDDVGNWLNQNPPPGLSEDVVEKFIESLRKMGELTLDFTRLYLIAEIGRGEEDQ